METARKNKLGSRLDLAGPQKTLTAEGGPVLGTRGGLGFTAVRAPAPATRPAPNCAPPPVPPPLPASVGRYHCEGPTGTSPLGGAGQTRVPGFRTRASPLLLSVQII